MNELKRIEPEYVYITIPAEYICVYHRILAMMADYGEEMLKDCKATCTDKNSGVIECFNMFNSAIAARKLGKDKLAEIIIKYVKAKINQIYKNKDNSTSFVFPIDETGQLKAFVSCGKRPIFEINPDDGDLYEHKFGNGFNEHFNLGKEDRVEDDDSIVDEDNIGLHLVLKPRYEIYYNEVRPCADIIVFYDGKQIDINDTIYQYYFDERPVVNFNDVTNVSIGLHSFMLVVTYKDETKIITIEKEYNTQMYNDLLKEIDKAVTDITDKIGKPDGIAPLDSIGKVPALHLPSYVDDVLEFDSRNDFPEIGESGKIYIAKDTGRQYRWTSEEYVLLPINYDFSTNEDIDDLIS